MNEKADRLRVMVEVSSFADLSDGDVEDFPLLETITRLQEILDGIPEQHRGSAVLNMRCYGDYAHCYCDVKYFRDETDEEYEARVKRDAAAKKAARVVADRREREIYERLKKKYG